MQAAIDRYPRHKNYLVSIIIGRDFTKSEETLNAKANQLRRQGKAKENAQTKHSHTAKHTNKFSGEKANLETTMALRWQK